MKFKRYCKTLSLQNNGRLIKKYIEVHSKVWPEIINGMKEIGIIDMEIYIQGNQLFMIMDTVVDFDHEKAMSGLAKKTRQAEWEAYVATFQNTSANASAKDKWQLMDRIFEIDLKKHDKAVDGQVKETQSENASQPPLAFRSVKMS